MPFFPLTFPGQPKGLRAELRRLGGLLKRDPRFRPREATRRNRRAEISQIHGEPSGGECAIPDSSCVDDSANPRTTSTASCQIVALIIHVFAALVFFSLSLVSPPVRAASVRSWEAVSQTVACLCSSAMISESGFGQADVISGGAMEFMVVSFDCVSGHSGFGGDDFIPASAARMAFCTAGLERFPRCPPCSKTVSRAGSNVARSQARSSSPNRKSF